MTIRRQYSLPNCTLVLDGLSDGSSSSIPDPRPLMSSLFNAECHFVGHKQPLFGGKDFLTSLVTTVSNYAQEFLSGIPHPVSKTPAPNHLVSLTKGDRENTHCLQATLEQSSDPTADGKPTQIELSTVQLFDLLEAIDQFLADRRTLPDLMVTLQPLTKALATPIAAQAMPAGLGLASLVVASLIGYALPVPKVSAPNSVNPAVVAPKSPPTNKPIESPADSKTPQPSPSTTPSATSSLPPTMGKLTEATQVGFLQRKLQRDLHQNWQERGQIQQPTTFKVNVNQDGQIVNYAPVGKIDQDTVNLTPLAKLSTQNTDPNQAIGDFNVVFNPNGSIDIKPANKLQGKMNLGKEITEPQLTTTLAQKLKTQLQQSIDRQKLTPTTNLYYRVAVTKAGEIADYEPLDRRAYNNEAKTPLPQLAKFNPQAAISQEPLAQYDVIFKPTGEIQVTPK